MLETTEVYKEAVEMLSVDGQEVSLYKNYSGRAMYGLQVPGIVADVGGPKVGAAITLAVITMTLKNGGDMDEAIAEIWLHIPARSDNMGLSFIYY